MEKINKKQVENIYRQIEGNKTIKGCEIRTLSPYYKKAMDNFEKYLSHLSAYEMGQVINSISHYLDDKNALCYGKERIYKRGDIVILDFGFMNFGYEFSYPHPAVVLSQTKNFLFVAPCTSKKFGKGYSDVLDGYKEDGFQENTGVLLDGVRWVSKNRVIEIMGCCSIRILRKIEEYTLNHILTYSYEKNRKRKELIQLQEEITKLENQLSELQKRTN